MLGRKLEDLFPVAFLPENHALAIAIMSYNGGIDFGLLGDYDALPDIDVIAEGIDDALHGAARRRRGGDRRAARAVRRDEAVEEVEAAKKADAAGQPQNGRARRRSCRSPSGRGKRGPAADDCAPSATGRAPAGPRPSPPEAS